MPAVIAELAVLLLLASIEYVAFATVPVTFAPVTLLIAVPSPTSVAPLLPIVAALIAVPVSVPLSVSPVSVPTAVILLCVASIT